MGRRPTTHIRELPDDFVSTRPEVLLDPFPQTIATKRLQFQHVTRVKLKNASLLETLLR